jgi:hypothetical protein
MKYTSSAGTLMTAAEAGAVEYDGKVLYFGNEASNRGVIGAEYFICLSGTNTLTSVNTEQSLFDSVGAGTLTLPTGTYFFECLLGLSSMSGTSGNMGFNVLGAGSATVGSVFYMEDGFDNAINVGGTPNTAGASNAAALAAPLVTASTSTELSVRFTGTFRVTAAGTIIPSCTLTTAAAAVVRIGSFFRCRCVGSATVQTVGQWS